MQHLESTRLAAFDHEPFTVDELAHLAVCAACRRERDDVAALVTLARAHGQGEPPADAPRLTSWEQIAAGMHAVADDPFTASITVSSGPDALERPASSRPWFRQARRVAAAVALVSGGAVMGRLSQDRALPIGAVSEGSTVARPVAHSDGGFTSVQDATEALDRAQREYERASVWLAANDPATRSSDVYRARLAALDQMMAASRAALREAPQDPVLNHYYLSAWSAREATLQALSSALPVDKVIERY